MYSNKMLASDTDTDTEEVTTPVETPNEAPAEVETPETDEVANNEDAPASDEE